MSKKAIKIESPLEDEDWPFAPEEDLGLFLEMEHQKFQEDPSHALPAFNALAYVVSSVWQREETGPPEASVVLPRWVAETLAERFFQYLDAAHEGQNISLGKAYGLEGRGQGKQPPVIREKINVRDIRLLTWIAQRKLAGIKIEAALQEMVDETGLSLSQVRRIWERDGKRALSGLQNIRTRKTS